MNARALTAARGQAGMTLLEVLLCAGIGLLLVATGGFLFIGQVKGYNDIGSQARLQTMTKNAVQSMNTEIANTGACLANKRNKFIMQGSQLQFTYIDLKSRHCSSTDTVTVLYFVKSGQSVNGDTLMQRIQCNSQAWVNQPIVYGQGAVTLAFTYYDLNGATTAVPANVRAVQFSLDVKSQAGKSLFVRDRNPVLRVELLN